jgi:hypothetical protein
MCREVAEISVASDDGVGHCIDGDEENIVEVRDETDERF